MPKTDPLRSCLGCREVKPKQELLRFVLDPDGNLFPDVSKKLPGRGAYTCFSKNCLESALKKRQFSRSFKTEVRISSDSGLIVLVLRLLEERIISTIALANKAGRAVSGSDKVMEALKKGETFILILAEDIAVESRAKFMALAQKAGVDTYSFSIKERLGSPLGKDIRTAVAVHKGSFAESLQTDLKRYWNFFEGGAK